MTSWRAGVGYRTGVTPNNDFIVSSNAPARITSEHVEGAVPPAEYNTLPVPGSYAGALVIESNIIPKGWATVRTRCRTASSPARSAIPVIGSTLSPSVVVRAGRADRPLTAPCSRRSSSPAQAGSAFPVSVMNVSQRCEFVPTICLFVERVNEA